MNVKKITAKLLTLIMAFTMLSSVAYARNIGNYDLIIPRFGAMNYSSPLKKTDATRAVNNNTSIGGGYTLNCAIYKSSDNSKMSGTKSFSSGDRIYISYNDASSAKGQNVKLGIWSSLTTTVKVQASGSWSPDE